MNIEDFRIGQKVISTANRFIEFYVVRAIDTKKKMVTVVAPKDSDLQYHIKNINIFGLYEEDETNE